jgi:hypothetical protein
MTSEVAILNQRALVFAADSATTVRYWASGSWHVRYFKGANKLFELSRKKPIGLMIYNNASLHEVPWEVLIKEFRNRLGADSCGALADYAARFFDFIKSNVQVFPPEVRESTIRGAARIASYRYLNVVRHQDGFDDLDADAKLRKLIEFLKQSIQALQECEVVSPFDRAAVGAFFGMWSAAVRDEIETTHSDIVGEALDLLTEASTKAVIIKYEDYLSHTGIVIGGFSDDGFFPELEIFDCYGFLGDEFICKRSDNSFAIDRNRTAAIEPFATTSMINTFRMGISPDVFDSVLAATREKLQDMATAVLDQSGGVLAQSVVDGLLEAAMDDHRKKWFHKSLDQHFDPLARVVGALPVPEMAALAKSLIELQSLKERVTKTSESVSGPIDVAVISKHDGFIWIDRKHYFQSELNPRFFARQSEF